MDYKRKCEVGMIVKQSIFKNLFIGLVAIICFNQDSVAMVRAVGVSKTLAKQAAKTKRTPKTKNSITATSVTRKPAASAKNWKFTQSKVSQLKVSPVLQLAPKIFSAKTIAAPAIVPVASQKNYYTRALKFTTALTAAGLGSAVAYAYIMSEIDKAESTIAEQYSINVMWINRKLNIDQKYIYPAKNQAELYEKLIDPIIKWAIKNPGRTVNFWYDSQVTTAAAINNTKYLIWLEQLKQLRFTTVVLKDIRDLQKVRECPECVTPNVPVYFRADLLRVIATIETVKAAPGRYFIYTDLDMKPISDAELFDSKTRIKLAKYGLVLANAFLDKKCNAASWENGFHMVNPQKTTMLAAMNDVLVDSSIKHLRTVIERDPKFEIRRIEGSHVFQQYNLMWLHFLKQEGVIFEEKGWITPAKHIKNYEEDYAKGLAVTNKIMVRPGLSGNYDE